MRLFKAICSLIEAKAESLRPVPPAPAAPPEHQPQGNNFSSTERQRDIRLHEMNNDERPQSPYGSISLRWYPKGES